MEGIRTTVDVDDPVMIKVCGVQDNEQAWQNYRRFISYPDPFRVPESRVLHLRHLFVGFGNVTEYVHQPQEFALGQALTEDVIVSKRAFRPKYSSTAMPVMIILISAKVAPAVPHQLSPLSRMNPR